METKKLQVVCECDEAALYKMEEIANSELRHGEERSVTDNEN